MAYITKEIWKKKIKGWIITGCAIRNKDILYFCARKNIPYEKASSMWDNEIPTLLIGVYLDTPSDPYGQSYVTGFTKPKLGVALQPKEQAILSSRDEDGIVEVIGSGDWPMEYIDKGEFPAPRKIKCINGYAYAAGWRRHVYKRTDIGEWERLVKGIPETGGTERGFEDLDAFNEQDMYAVGGDGDVWHYDGDIWHPCAFPSNEQLSTVLCAPDGYVYIGGEGCSLWKGRGDNWEKVSEGYAVILWHDIRWFDGKVWLCSEYQLRIWDGKELQQVMDGDNIILASGHMDVRDGILVVAGDTEADMFDGKTWKKIITAY